MDPSWISTKFLLAAALNRQLFIWGTILEWFHTSTGKDPNGYTLGSDPTLVWIVYPYQNESSSSSVNGKPICTHIGIDPCGSVLV